MIRHLVERYVGKVSDQMFREAAEETTRDVWQNRLIRNSKTYMEYIVYVMVTYIRIVQKIEKSQKQIA